MVPGWYDYYCAMHLWCIVSWSWVQYIFGVASLVLCIVSYIAHLLYHIVKNQEDMNAFDFVG